MGGLQVIRIRAEAMVVRLPPALADLDENFERRNDDLPPLVEVADLKRAMRQLAALGFEVGPMVEEDWEALADLWVPNIGAFRLIGPWLRGRKG